MSPPAMTAVEASVLEVRLNSQGVAMNASPSSAVRRPTITSTASPLRRKADDEARAAAGSVVERERAPVSGDDRPRDGEPEAGAAALAIARGLETDERLEHARALGFRDAGTRVAHGEEPRVVLARHVELDEATGGRVLDGILEQVQRRAPER